MNLPGEQMKPTDSSDLAIFVQVICETCKHQEYCAILAHAGMYGGASEWRVVNGEPTCIRLETAGYSHVEDIFGGEVMARKDIDRKYMIRAWSNNSKTQYTEANSVLFLARDPALPATLRTYRAECERLGAGELQLRAVDELLERVLKFQERYPTKVGDVVSGPESARLFGETD